MRSGDAIVRGGGELRRRRRIDGDLQTGALAPLAVTQSDIKTASHGPGLNLCGGGGKALAAAGQQLEAELVSHLQEDTIAA